MKILIIQQKMIGDVLTSSIMFKAIKGKYPKAELHYLINTHTFSVVENNPYIDHFIFFSKAAESSKKELFKLAKAVRKEKFDVVIDVYAKLSSNLITLLSGAKTKISYHKKYTAFLLDHPVKRLNKPENNASLAIENRLKLLEPLKIPFQHASAKIYLRNTEIIAAKKFLRASNINLDKPLLMFSVLGSSSVKTYPAKYMAILLDYIVEIKNNAQILFNYIPNQKQDAQEIFNYCLAETQKHIFFNIFGKSLREFLAITKQCDALIGNEGGANNMGKALGIPTFTIFSPYLNKSNWFGENETGNNVAIHLSDFINYNGTDLVQAKKDPKTYYLKLKPEYIKPPLKAFLSNL